MSFETVERLKQDYTDKWVTVDTATPELRRFVGLSGQIKTVNMNGRALVQFDSPVDISWYDIDLSYLKVINAPLPKKVATDKHAEAAEKKAAPTPVVKPTPGGKSPLELAREQAAARAAGGAATPAATTAPATAAAAGEKPLSKLEMARQQAAAAKAKAAGGTVSTPASAPVAAAAPTESAPTPAAAEPAAPAAPAPAAPVMVGEDGKPLSKLEMARRQGAFKKP